MKAQDYELFSELWAKTHSVYDIKPNPEAVETVFSVLQPYGLSEIRHALQRHLGDPEAGMYPPKPAHLVKLIKGDHESRTLRAWTDAYTAMCRIGTYQSVQFSDLLIHKVLEDMGGWLAFGRIQNSEVPFKQNEFCTRYRGYLITPPMEPLPSHLPGSTECNNLKEFPDRIPKPVQIGFINNQKQLNHNKEQA